MYRCLPLRIMTRYTAALPISSSVTNGAAGYLRNVKAVAARTSASVSLTADRGKTTSAERKRADVFKPWPVAMVESNGDYRAESYLEEHIGGPLYSKQHDLPRLPVPKLGDTIDRLMPTALPLAETEEEKKSFLRACESFPTEAEELQRRLIQRRNGEMKDSSFLQHWWNTGGYLQVRDPVVVNVSYFFHFSDDGTLPVGNGNLGVLRGASILTAAAEFRKRVCTGTLPCETIGRKEPKTPLCSVAFKYMFNSCRIPRREQDSYRMYDPSLHTHCVVARRGQFFAVDFVDKETGDPLPLTVIEDRLQQCVELADRQIEVPRLGWLTSSDRDSWADARTELLLSGGPQMEQSLSKLESGALMLCLDDEDPVSRKQCGEIFWHGGLLSGDNRWFDKSIQIFCTNNGKAGLMGEHSMMDGMPMIGLADHITKTSYRDAKKRHPVEPTSKYDPAVSNVKNIFADCASDLKTDDHQVGRFVDKAKSDFVTLVTEHDLHVQSFQGYGSNYIKSVGYSPDAYVQMAIQLATYRLFGKQAGTYEATQVRPFLHGRTETTRSVSPESNAFVKAMGLRPKHDENDKASRSEKLSLLHSAVTSHVKYIGNAAKGMGVDRHLLGLSMLVEEGEIAPVLNSHPLHIRAKTWRVSTSHLTHPKFENWGFGEVVPNGVGVAYGIKADSCIFNIAARKEHCWTDRLSHLLEEALLEMRLLNEMDKPLVSKL